MSATGLSFATVRQTEKKATKSMLSYHLNNKWHLAAGTCGLVVFFGLIGHWAYRNAADPRKDLLQGNYTSALEKYKSTANDGDPAAQNTVGNFYYLGLGVERDYEEAARWYLRAAKKNEGAALLNLGILHKHGFGVKQDVVKAFAYFRLADKARIDSAEIHKKFLTRMNYITAHMVEAARTDYGELHSLIKHTKIGAAPNEQPRPSTAQDPSS